MNETQYDPSVLKDAIPSTGSITDRRFQQLEKMAAAQAELIRACESSLSQVLAAPSPPAGANLARAETPPPRLVAETKLDAKLENLCQAAESNARALASLRDRIRL